MVVPDDIRGHAQRPATVELLDDGFSQASTACERPALGAGQHFQNFSYRAALFRAAIQCKTVRCRDKERAIVRRVERRAIAEFHAARRHTTTCPRIGLSNSAS